MSSQFVKLPLTGGSGGVKSLNTLTGDLTIDAGAGITVTPSGGNTLTIASSTPNVYARYINAALTNPSITPSNIIYYTVDQDAGGIYNNSTGVITIPHTGYYDINFALFVEGTFALNTQTQIWISKNGGPAISQINNNSGGAENDMTSQLSDTLYLTAEDAITFVISCYASGASVPGGPTGYFSIKSVP